MRIEEILRESCVLADLRSQTKRGALAELVDALQRENMIRDGAETLTVILEREKLGSTGIGDGVAIPHGKMKQIGGIVAAFGRSAEGVEFDAVDGKRVHIFFLLIASEDSASMHLKVLSRVSRILRDPSFRDRLMRLPDAPSIYTSVIEEDRKLER